MQPTFFEEIPRSLPELHQVNSKYGAFWCRKECHADADMAVKRINDYNRFILPLHAHEVWLDIGAHIGTFSAVVAPNVAKVLAFEACPESAAILKMNMERLPNVSCFHKAVIGTERDVAHFTQAPSRTMSHIATKHSRSFIEVPAVSFNSLLVQDVCVKMDIEGGERDILDHLTDWSRIKRFMLEFHSKALRDDDHAYMKKVLVQFQSTFRAVETDFNEEKHRWVWCLYGER